MVREGPLAALLVPAGELSRERKRRERVTAAGHRGVAEQGAPAAEEEEEPVGRPGGREPAPPSAFSVVTRVGRLAPAAGPGSPSAPAAATMTSGPPGPPPPGSGPGPRA